MREALQEARARQSSVARENLIFSIDGQNRPGTLIVEPIGDRHEAGHWVVAFRDTGQSSTTASATKPPLAIQTSKRLSRNCARQGRGYRLR